MQYKLPLLSHMVILRQQPLQSPLVLSALSANLAMKQATIFGFHKPKGQDSSSILVADESTIPVKEELAYTAVGMAT